MTESTEQARALTRYHLWFREGGRKGLEMQIRPDGEWVRWSDVAAALQSAQAEEREMVRRLRDGLRVLLVVAIRDGHLSREAVNLLMVHHVQKCDGKVPTFEDAELAAEVDTWVAAAIPTRGQEERRQIRCSVCGAAGTEIGPKSSAPLVCLQCSHDRARGQEGR